MREHYTNPAIQKAFGVLEAISADETAKYLAEMHEDALRNEVSMLAAARREGYREGLAKARAAARAEAIAKGKVEAKKEIALNMIAMGAFTIEQISQGTGLSLDEVRLLQRTQKAEVSW